MRRIRLPIWEVANGVLQPSLGRAMAVDREVHGYLYADLEGLTTAPRQRRCSCHHLLPLRFCWS